uniref:Uncharacterized protein n=1 Tax=Leersia perrieri TaxID=77586 RepID=A0A0D9XUQ2_9ORYZ
MPAVHPSGTIRVWFPHAMAELAAGAVSSLLGIIRSEALLLDNVQGDVQFIKEEMESINSFLAHLARTAPPDGEHDEQIRTWMKQVRELAHDCSSCIDFYIQRGNPAIHRARAGLVWRYFWWAPWFARKLIAQHKAAIQLSKLKDRARDVGERRLRYGVEIPTKKAEAVASAPLSHGSKKAAASTPPSHAEHAMAADARGDEEDEDGGHNHAAMANAVHDHDRRRALEPRTREDYCREKLNKWLKEPKPKVTVPSIAIEALCKEDATDVAQMVVSCVAADEAGFNPAVWINLPAVHSKFDMPLEPWEILCYILRELKLKSKTQPAKQGTDQHTQEEEGTDDSTEEYDEDNEEEEEEDSDEDDDDEEEEEEEYSDVEDGLQFEAWNEKDEVYDEIWAKITKTNVNDRIEEIKTKIDNKAKNTADEIERWVRIQYSTDIDLPVPFFICRWPTLPGVAASPNDSTDVVTYKKWARSAYLTLKSDEVKIVKKTANKLKDHIEEGKDHLTEEKYINILRRVFQAQEKDRSATTSTGSSILGEDQIKEIAHKAIQDKQLEKPMKFYAIEEAKKKIRDIREEIEDELVLEGIVGKIKEHLNKDKRALIILQDDKGFLSSWEKTRDALELLGCACAGVMAVIITKKSQAAKKFCCPPHEPIYYSLAGLYHDSLLQLTSQQAKGNNNPNSQIFRDILNKCDLDEFCMKMFAHALYAKPNRSNNELHKLHNALISQQSVGSNTTKVKVNPERSNDTTQQVPQQSLRHNAKKMFKFSYHDLPREYKSCLLYLAIFPEGHSIKRSNIEGRWVVEGLINEEDWPSALKRLLAGRVYSDPSRSSNGLSLRNEKTLPSSVLVPHKIEKMENMEALSNVRVPRYSNKLLDHIGKLWQLRKLGVVIDGHEGQLRNLLRVISDLNESLQSLSVTLVGIRNERTPSINEEILPVGSTIEKLVPLPDNNIYSRFEQHPKLLESLSISGVTHGVHLLPLLAKVSGNLAKLTLSRTWLNHKNLKDIAKLSNLCRFRLRHKAYTDDQIIFMENEFPKLKCLIIEGNNMFSIKFEAKATPNLEKIMLSSTSIEYIYVINRLPNLKELELNGVNSWLQLPWIASAHHLSKVTLHGTLLDLSELMKTIAKLTSLRSLMLLEKSCIGSSLNFKEGEFTKLNLLVVKCSDITGISFSEKAASKLNKIVWSFKKIESLSGISNLPQLKELELTGDLVPDQVIQETKAHKSKPLLTHRKSQGQPEEKRSAAEEKRSPFPWLPKINKHWR